MSDREPRLLLLDTHVWIWVVEGVAAELAAPAIGRIEKASDAGAIRVAAISVWEVAMLEARGRLRLALDIDEWVRQAVTAPGTQLVRLSSEIAVDSVRLARGPGRRCGGPDADCDGASHRRVAGHTGRAYSRLWRLGPPIGRRCDALRGDRRSQTSGPWPGPSRSPPRRSARRR